MITRSDDDYRIPAPLVNWLITGIVGSIVAIGAYMVGWAVNDAAWKSVAMQRIEAIERNIAKMEAKAERDGERRQQVEGERRRGEKP